LHPTDTHIVHDESFGIAKSKFSTPQPPDASNDNEKNIISSTWEKTIAENNKIDSKHLHHQTTIDLSSDSFNVDKSNSIPKNATGGNVKKIIGAWEQLFEQVAATEEQSKEQMARAALVAKQLTETNQKLELMDEAERFTIGDTHIYNISQLLDTVGEYLIQSLTGANRDHFSLSCGILGSAGEKPPVVAYAAAVRTEPGNSQSTIYVALTLKSARGHENDPAVFSKFKISIFSKGVEFNILERLVELVPAESNDSTSSVIESAAIDTRKSNLQRLESMKQLKAEGQTESNVMQKSNSNRNLTNGTNATSNSSIAKIESNELITTNGAIVCFNSDEKVSNSTTVQTHSNEISTGIADINSNKVLTIKSQSNLPEIIRLDELRTYDSSFLSPVAIDFLTKSFAELKSKNESLPLSCGVFTEKGKKPVITGVASASRSNGSSTAPFSISFVVHAIPGHENDAEVLGVKRIAIFSKTMDINIFDHVFDISSSTNSNPILSNKPGMPNLNSSGAQAVFPKSASQVSSDSFVLTDITAVPQVVTEKTFFVSFFFLLFINLSCDYHLLD
jgi:hypothetical protein